MTRPPMPLRPERERSLTGALIGLAAFFAVLVFFNPEGADPGLSRMAAVVVLMAIWWILEAVPFAVTALLPFILFPVFGLMSAAETAPYYFNSIIFLFIGGFLIALAMERWNLHRRIALHVLLVFGRSPARLVLGFMVVCCFFSAWISNTAMTLAMLPVGMAVLSKLEDHYDKSLIKPLAISLMLGIAYACTIGGIATPVGTPPNLAFRGIYADLYPDAPGVTFAQWCFFAMPLSVVMLGLTWFVLCRVLFRTDPALRIERTVLREQLHALGPLRREEAWIGGIFLMTALLWVFRQPIELDRFTLPGWQQLLPGVKGIDDGTVAVFMALLLFLIPARNAAGRTRLLTESIIPRIPWGIILLFGGGYALAVGFQRSGLSTWVAQTFFTDFGALGLWGMIGVTCVVMSVLTEFTSNTPSTQLVLPIVGATAVMEQIDSLWLMLPATITASMSFMMPVGTPPNAIVFSTGRVRIIDMVKAGLVLNVIGLVLVLLASRFLFVPILGLDMP
jgi:sodium-dependent dicarboxylate transporter 2/3/5